VHFSIVGRGSSCGCPWCAWGYRGDCAPGGTGNGLEERENAEEGPDLKRTQGTVYSGDPGDVRAGTETGCIGTQ